MILQLLIHVLVPMRVSWFNFYYYNNLFSVCSPLSTGLRTELCLHWVCTCTYLCH